MMDSAQFTRTAEQTEWQTVTPGVRNRQTWWSTGTSTFLHIQMNFDLWPSGDVGGWGWCAAVREWVYRSSLAIYRLPVFSRQPPCVSAQRQDVTGPVRSGPVRSAESQRAAGRGGGGEFCIFVERRHCSQKNNNNTGSERWCEKTAGEVSVCLPVCSHSQCVRQQQVLGVVGGLGTRLAVSVGHDEAWWLVPPVEHEQQQQVPHLVAGAQVVELPCSATTHSAQTLIHRGINKNKAKNCLQKEN